MRDSVSGPHSRMTLKLSVLQQIVVSAGVSEVADCDEGLGDGTGHGKDRKRWG